jgi:hypothetical protein
VTLDFRLSTPEVTGFPSQPLPPRPNTPFLRFMTSHGLSSSAVETLAGFTAGIVSTLSLHPLDLVKTRLQGKLLFSSQDYMVRLIWTSLVDRSSSSRLGSSLRIIREISYHEGGFAAFYRGLAPNLVGNSTSWALYFLCYSSLKDAIRTYRQGNNHMLASSDYFIASGTAGMPDMESNFSSYALTCGHLKALSRRFWPIQSGWSKLVCYQPALMYPGRTRHSRRVYTKSTTRRAYLASTVVLSQRCLGSVMLPFNSWLMSSWNSSDPRR